MFHMNLKDKTWEWVEAYLPLFLFDNNLEEARSEIFGFPKGSKDKLRKVEQIRLLCTTPIQWEEFLKILQDTELLESLVLEKGGWEQMPDAILNGIMERSIRQLAVPTIELLLNRRPHFAFEEEGAILSFLDFEQSSLYDFPVADRLIALWKITPSQIHENFKRMKGDLKLWPAIPRLLQRYPL